LRFWSLKTKITLVVALLVLFLLGLFSILCFSYFEKSLKAEISTQQFVLVSEIATEVDSMIDTGRAFIAGTAQTISPEILKSAEKTQDFLDQNRGVGIKQFFNNGISIFSPAGRLLAASPHGPLVADRNRSKTDFFARIVVTGKPCLSKVYFSRDKPHHPLITFAAPIKDPTGHIRAVLCGSVDLLKSNFFENLADIRLGQSGYLYLFDQSRSTLIGPDQNKIVPPAASLEAHPLIDRVIKGFEGTGERVTSTDQPVLSSFKHLQNTDWILGADFPLAEAYAPVYRAERFFAAALAVTLVFSILLVWFFMKYLTAPLLLFTRHVEQITGEEDGPPLIDIRADDEIATLAKSFNRMLSDIDQKTSALEDQRRFSESLVQRASIPTLVLDTKHRVLAWNRACELLTGIQAAEIVGTRNQWWAFYEHQRPVLADLVLEKKSGDLTGLYESYRRSPHCPEGLQGETWLTFRDGTKHYCVFDAAPIKNDKGEVVAVIESIRDITDLKISEENFKKSHSLLAATLESTADGILAIDRQGRIVACNRKFVEMWNIPEAILASGAIDTVRNFAQDQVKTPEQFLSQIAALDDNPTETGWGTYHFKDGRIVAHYSKPQYIDNQIVGRVKSFRDVTEQHEAAAADRRRQLLLKAATESFLRFLLTGNIHDMATVMLDRCLEISGAAIGLLYDLENPDQAQLLAVSENRGEWKGTTLFKDLESKREMKPSATLCSPGKLLHASATRGETVLWNNGGTPLFLDNKLPPWHPPIVNFLGVPLKIGAQVVGYIGLANKAGGFSESDRREMESFAQTAALAIRSVRAEQARQQTADQLHVVQKFEAIGQLAGGIAHDFNNLLTVINGYSTHLIRALKDDDAKRGDAELVLQAGHRASALTRQLLAFSRRQVLELKVLDLNALIHSFSKILQRFLQENIAYCFSPGEGVGPVKADPGQLEQVLLNLVINARDAMAQGGDITISTSEADIDEAFVQGHSGAVPGRYVVLSVRDSGTGMSEEIQARVFEPFYTTKEQGRGTGLGLSTVFGIVKQSAGYILLESAPGKGSCFKIFLPRTDEPPEEIGKDSTPPPSGGQGTILLVEDELAVLRLVEQALRESGFTVLSAQTAREALEKLEKKKGEMLFRETGKGAIDLLVTDLVMPAMSGAELAKQVEERVPGIKILYMSGYGQFHGKEGLHADGFRAFLQKPFTPDALMKKVRCLLGAEVST